MAGIRSSISLAAILAVVPLVAPAQENSARVTVYGTHQGGNVVYYFEVRNGGSREIRRLFVGCDCRSLEDASLPELQVLPVNAAPVRTDDFGIWYDAGPEAIVAPSGWRTRLLRPTGSRGHWIEWYVPGAADPGIRPGAALGGFAVAVPGGDPAYLAARYTLHYAGEVSSPASARLRLADTNPPELTLAARLEPEASASVARVHVNVEATDDRDPEPRVVVQSIERTEGATPALRLRYTATDGSGNRTTAAARVALPGSLERVHTPPDPSLLRRASLP